ncbi:MAG: hypothetical protein HZA53_17055 [Planctomycetes bacterium]|nr:hypothetical protein [Planctomycetota bacterium]
MRPLRNLLLASLVAFPAASAVAQERRSDAHPGGPVALASTAFAWSADDARAWIGDRVGERVVLRLAREDLGDPLSECGRPAREFVLEPESRFVGDASEPVGAIAHAAAVELVGGTWLGWWKLLLRDGKASRIALELHEAHRRGVPLVGTGAAAGFLAAYSPVERAELGREEKNLHRPDTASPFAGLGLVDGLFDAEALAGGSLERELRVLLRSGLVDAVFVSGAGAWIVDEQCATARFVGRPGAAALVVDVANARRMRESLREGRVSLLEPGQRWDLARRRPVAVEPAWKRGPVPAVGSALSSDPLDARRVVTLLEAREAFRASEVETATVVLRLWTDEDTRGGAEEPWSRVRFDVSWAFPEPVR